MKLVSVNAELVERIRALSGLPCPSLPEGELYFNTYAGRVRAWWRGKWRTVADPALPRWLVDQMVEAEAAAPAAVLDEDLERLAAEFGIRRKPTE